MPKQERLRPLATLFRTCCIDIFMRCAPKACGTEERQTGCEKMFATDQETAKLSQAGICILSNPMPLAAAQYPALFVSPPPVVLQTGHNRGTAAQVMRKQLSSPPMKMATVLCWPATL
jgi:hypothetical protein